MFNRFARYELVLHVFGRSVFILVGIGFGLLCLGMGVLGVILSLEWWC